MGPSNHGSSCLHKWKCIHHEESSWKRSKQRIQCSMVEPRQVAWNEWVHKKWMCSEGPRVLWQWAQISWSMEILLPFLTKFTFFLNRSKVSVSRMFRVLCWHTTYITIQGSRIEPRAEAHAWEAYVEAHMDTRVEATCILVRLNKARRDCFNPSRTRSGGIWINWSNIVSGSLLVVPR